MRLFVGIPLNKDIKSHLERVKNQLEEKAEKGNFTRTDNFHLTLRFIGEVEEASVPEIQQRLAEITYPSFLIQTDKMGCFEKKRGLIPWMGLEPNAHLQALHTKVDDALELAGIPCQDFPYTPHLTLGRNVRFSEPIGELTLSVSQEVTEFILFHSHQVDDSLTYSPLFHFYLK